MNVGTDMGQKINGAEVLKGFSAEKIKSLHDGVGFVEHVIRLSVKTRGIKSLQTKVF